MFHVYPYAPVPPDPATVAEPVVPPLQRTLVVDVMPARMVVTLTGLNVVSIHPAADVPVIV